MRPRRHRIAKPSRLSPSSDAGALGSTGAVQPLNLEAVAIDPPVLDGAGRRASGRPHRRGRAVGQVLLVADVVALTAAFILAQIVSTQFAGEGMGPVSPTAEFVTFTVTLPVWIVVAKLYGLYGRDAERTGHITVNEIMPVFHLVTVGAWILLATAALTDIVAPSAIKVITLWSAAILLILLARTVARAYCSRQVWYLQNAVVIGAGKIGQLVSRKLLRHPEWGVNLVGFVDVSPRELGPDLKHLPLLGSPGQISEIIRAFDIERAVVAFSRDSHEETMRVIRVLDDLDVQVEMVPRLFETIGPSVYLHTVEGIPMLGLPPLRFTRSAVALKRVLDVALAAGGLAVLSPILLLIAARIRFESPGPVFYKHERIGRNGAPFRLYKFRTMHLRFCRGNEYGGGSAEAEFQQLMSDPARQEEFAASFKLQADPRVTAFGSFLRRTSLDELPQLFNVLRGELSLVGPRPIVREEMERYSVDDAPTNLGREVTGYWEIEDLRPGVTGYWQINGRSDIDYAERMRLDMAYVRSWSTKLDLLIIAATVRALISRTGAY